MVPDYPSISSQLVRALRGRRSQQHLSERLGYRSNALYTWEAGSSFPSASRLFQLVERVGVDLDAGLARFFRHVPPGLSARALATPAGLRRLLLELRGHTRINALAEATGFSRFTLSRWLSGKTQPNVPEFLCYVDHASLRLLDFIAILIDPELLAETRQAWSALQAARRLGYERPATQAVLRALETTSYRDDASITRLAALTGLPDGEVEQCLQALQQSGQVVADGSALAASAAEQTIDFRRDPAAAQSLKAHWAELAARRTRRAGPGLFAYNVFAVSRDDLERLQDLQRAYLKEMRTIIAASRPTDVVALANFQLFSLGDLGAE